MARHEEDREDLFSEFRSAVQKWELQIAESDESFVCGIRKDGRYSIYFDQDHCYHFNPELKLLRAYRGGSLYRSQGSTLARLTRERNEKETVLRRIDLDDGELHGFLNELQGFVRGLRVELERENYRILRVEPVGCDLQLVKNAVEKLCEDEIQLAPAFPTKRK